LGLIRGTVALVSHNEEWHRAFEHEKERLGRAIGDVSIPIEHIGSTAICGIAAKPILDIMIGTPEFEPKLQFRDNLESLGYEYKGENGIPQRHYFGKGIPRTVHLNVVRYAGEIWLSHIAFRDRLNQNPEIAREYERLKFDLAKRFGHDRESYTNGKTEFIQKVVAMALKNKL